MPRYIDADFLIEQLQPAKNSVWNKNDHSKSMSEMIEDFCTELKNAPNADVVPKSEVDKLKIEIEALKIANEKMYAANKEQQAEIDSFLESVDELQADKADVTYFKKQLIANAKSEVAREIFEEIERIGGVNNGLFLYNFEIAKLKKKYTEET